MTSKQQVNGFSAQRRIIVICLLLLLTLGCGVIGFVDAPASLSGLSYWTAATGVPQPTVTIILGTTTPVYADTPIPAMYTTTPDLTTVTPETAVTPSPFWVTTTPMTITTTPPPPVTTTPSLPIIGFTSPGIDAVPYYRVGAFYMNSDVYIGGPDGLVFRITDHEMQPSPNNDEALYHFITIHVTNYTSEELIIPASDLFFIRHVEQDIELLTGRWLPQNEPLIANALPSYEAQQLEPIPANGERTLILGFVLPNGFVPELGLITNWNLPLEGGMPIWFYLEDDPLGPFEDALKPPPPTAIVLDDSGTYSGSNPPGSSEGRWPTTGIVTRGFGCVEAYTGIDGAGFGCPSQQPWFHNGVDISNVSGTRIWSPSDGTMLYAGPNPTGADCSTLLGSQPPHEGLGNYQRLGNGALLHYFGHLHTFLVTSGSVIAGQTIAEMGSTGCSTGTHLHWIMYQNGNLIDPAVWAGSGP